MSAFEAMLNNSAKDHINSACKAYSFDFFNDKSTAVSEEVQSCEPFSPFEWKEEENNVEYFKPTVKLELKSRMRVSDLLNQKSEEIQNEGKLIYRQSLLTELRRISIFS